jgi:hypothetical protein
MVCCGENSEDIEALFAVTAFGLIGDHLSVRRHSPVVDPATAPPEPSSSSSWLVAGRRSLRAIGGDPSLSMRSRAARPYRRQRLGARCAGQLMLVFVSGLGEHPCAPISSANVLG